MANKTKSNPRPVNLRGTVSGRVAENGQESTSLPITATIDLQPDRVALPPNPRLALRQEIAVAATRGLFQGVGSSCRSMNMAYVAEDVFTFVKALANQIEKEVM